MSQEPPRDGAIPGWGQSPPAEPATPPATPPGEAATQAPTGPGSAGGAVPGWGQAPAGDPASPPAAPPAPPLATPAWGATGQPSASGPSSPPGAWGGAGGSPTPPVPAAGGGWAGGPAPATVSSSNGCLRACLILVVVGAIALVVGAAAVLLAGQAFLDSLGISDEGNGGIGGACPIASNDDVRAVLGGNAEAIELAGMFDATLGLVLDKRVLPEAEDCWISADADSPTGRIARYTGGDAAARFREERQRAAPTSEDQGGGITIETDGYDGGDAPGIGDEAFCTGVSPAIQAGVLVRKGDTLVYVSLSGPADGSTPDFGLTDTGVVTAPSICARAQDLARRLLP